MKKQFLITIAMLLLGHMAWGQNCDEGYIDVDVTYDQATTELRVVINPVDPPAMTYTGIPYQIKLFVGDFEFSGLGGSNNVGANSLIDPIERTFNVAELTGLSCENGVFSCDNCEEAPTAIRFETQFTVRNDQDTLCSTTGGGGFPLIPCATDGGGGVTIDDERQVGNTIERLGDGRISALNADGTIIAFSSSGGYYICELVGEEWVPIGGEITTDTLVTQIFITADGGSVFVNLAGGASPQCSYRSGDSYNSSTLTDLDPPGLEGYRVTNIWDVTASGSYIIFQWDTEELSGIRLGSLASGGMISTQSDITNIVGSSAALLSAFLSDDGQYYCFSTLIGNQTGLYSVAGQEVATFDGFVLSASGDLSTCLVITDLNTGAGHLSRWDGGTTFTNSESANYSTTNSYSFSSDGSTCISNSASGQVEIANLRIDNGSLISESTDFTVSGITTYSGVSMSGNATRLAGFGGAAATNEDLFVFQFAEDTGITRDIDDERQVGNTIEDLGDGRLSVINDDGTIIAFSSARGYYICRLEGATWTPIGEEIVTASQVSEIFISGSGNAVFVNLSGGFTSQCSYVEGGSVTTNTLNITDRPGFRVTEIVDVTGGGNYILYRNVFFEDGEETFGIDCGNISQGGMITTQVNVSTLTGISTSSITRGFVSDDGQYVCVVDNPNNQTALWRITGVETGEEVGTFTGQVISASRDLSACLVQVNEPDMLGIITIWDGGETFTSSLPFPMGEITRYDFSADGSTCVSRTTDGEVDIVRPTIDNGVVVFPEGEEFTVVGIPGFRTVSISGDGNRIIVPDGEGGNRTDIFVFERTTSMEEPGDDTDTDGDGIPDIDDDDDDNDGILDSQECLTAIDYSETEFGPSEITIRTNRGDEVRVSVGSMVTDDALFGIGFPNSFNLDRGAENTNRFVMEFPFPIFNLEITAIDFDSDAFGTPTEWMDDFSIFPSRITGNGRAVVDQDFGDPANPQTIEGQGIIPDTINGVMTLFWDNLPAGTTTISWNNRRTTMDLDINFEIGGICIDTDEDGIPNEKDPDSDNDGCSDAEEAGHADDDEDGVLGTSPVMVDDNGLVTGQGGYTGFVEDVVVITDGCEVVDECDEFAITAGPDNFTACPGEALTITAASLLSNDMASDGVTLEIQELTIDNPEEGSLINNEDGTWTLTPSSGFNSDIMLSYIVKRDDGSLVFEENGHLYEFVAAQDISWEDARDAAAARTLGGLQGYLATITTQAENDFIQTKLEGRGWLGGREVGGVNTGEWRWVTGPEASLEDGSGLQFWDGNIGGSAIDGVYQNWREGEPNNFTGGGNTEGGEQFLHIRFDVAPGRWNDYPSRGFANIAGERIHRGIWWPRRMRNRIYYYGSGYCFTR